MRYNLVSASSPKNIFHSFISMNEGSGKSNKLKLTDITIRTNLLPGDIGYMIFLHGSLYQKEYEYGISFECYVAEGLVEFYLQYDMDKDCIWICEHEHKTIGFLLLIHRPGNAAQLRYFLLEPECRGMGLGKKLMELFMQHLKNKRFSSAYLWTTHEQEAAANLYKRFGFVLTDEKHSESFGKPLFEQKYELQLKK